MAVRPQKKITLLEDPRYPAFVARYQSDPLRFAVECTGFVPSEDQIELFESIKPVNARVSVVSGTGCFAKGTEMMRADGAAVAVEDIRVGDRLMGPDGNSARNVLELRRGRENMYRFTYMDGSSHVFNESHILTLAPGARFIERGKTDIVSITVRDWLQWPKTNKQRYYAYRSKVEKFERESVELPVPPYILGAWLGDGTSGKPQITTMDKEVDEAFTKWAESLGCTVSRSPNSKKSWNVYASRVVGTEKANPVTDALRRCGVWRQKHVPEAYKFASFDDRRELLAGVIDTDGYADGSNFILTQKNESIAKDIAWIARSVGCHATVRKIRKMCTNNETWGEYWSVNICRNLEIIPVRVERRKPVAGRKQRNHLLFGIRSVECLGEGDYYGFVLDGDHRFLANDFTVLHNTGKTASFARIALWHLLCFPFARYDGKVEIGSNTYIGAPIIKTVAEGVWKEMQDTRNQIQNGPHAWINDYYTIRAEKVSVNGFEAQWFITQIAMKKGEAIGVAGKHRFWQMIIIDEAAGVPDEHFDVIDGTQTQPGNRTLMASQGVRSAGRFYDTHHTLSTKNGGSWVALRFSSERSPFVTEQWLADRAQETGGRNTVEYQIRVLGLFAQDTSNVLLAREDIERAFENGPVIHSGDLYGYLILVDVGAGEYRDDSVIVIAKCVGYADSGEDARRIEYVSIPLCTNSRDLTDVAGEITELMGRYSNASLYIDAGGLGAGLVQMLTRQGVPVNKVIWGNPCFKRANRERFFNLRACAMVRFRDAIRQGRVRLPQGIAPKLREKIIDEGTRLPYHFTETGGLRYQMERKDVMRKEGIKSPDIIDAMSFAFLESANYIAAEDAYDDRRDLSKSVLSKAKALLADI